MSEIGSGSGSSYPGTLDTNITIETNAPNPGKTKAKAEVVNDLAASVIAIETTLGVSPQGSKTTVVARIDQEHNADGSHKDSLIVTVSGQNQNVTGRKVFASGISLGVDGLYGTATGYGTGKTTVGASGSMWFKDDINTSASMTAGGQINAESFKQTATRVSTGLNADYIDGIHHKLIEIGHWNMNATASVTVAHGLGTYPNKIISINVFILPNSVSAGHYPLNYFNGTTTEGGYYCSFGNVVLERTTGGLFDGVGFNATNINRGYIEIGYID